MTEHYMPIAIKELGRIFEVFNEKYFEGKLPIPVITVQSTKKRILGWCTLKTVWQPAIEKAMLIEEVKPDDKIFKYFRDKELTRSGGSTTRQKRVFKYKCPKCGLEAKGKTGIHVVCKMCDKELEMED